MLRPLPIRTLAVVVCAALCAAAGLAQAAEPIFPPALRIGLVPPPGFVAGQNIPGFRHESKAATILLAELPGAAFDTIEKQVTADLQANAQAPVKRTDITLAQGGSGFILYGTPNGPQGPVHRWTLIAHVGKVTAVATAIIPEQVKEVASDADIRAAFATLTVRSSVPLEEQLSVLPFSMRDLGGFRIVRVDPGNAVLLTEGPEDVIEVSKQPLLLVATTAMQSQPPPYERDALARRLFGEIGGLKDVRLTRSEPLRVAGQQGYETIVEAKDAKTGVEVTAVQWLRFGAGSLMRILGIARKDDWPDLYTRFRQVRDGLGPK